MYRHSYYQYQWHYPMHVYCNHSNWSNNWNPHSYNWNNTQPPPHYGNARLTDYGPRPFVVNMDQATEHNNTYRTALWTGKHLQVTLMRINAGDDIGLEVHPTTDQFIQIEEGQGLVQMGDSKDKLDFQQMAFEDYAIMIPAGKWHNVTNTGNTPLKIYVIYAPPEHPYGTVQETKAAAMSARENHYYKCIE
ncbi:cupin domain-containing protein [Paenibacillus sp. 481]|uniref:cupin domain-containing protein n=1 Tax=Paenibacillus sp. 481 TaxID=2835869 RepID=UPI001E560014|nr:cupin domain-containing protein [Paenibacillus sp. 481]UHA73440.1 cupin domain-containing protein [Paenibacillus sp. 481]